MTKKNTLAFYICFLLHIIEYVLMQEPGKVPIPGYKFLVGTGLGDCTVIQYNDTIHHWQPVYTMRDQNTCLTLKQRQHHTAITVCIILCLMFNIYKYVFCQQLYHEKRVHVFERVCICVYECALLSWLLEYKHNDECITGLSKLHFIKKCIAELYISVHACSCVC